ncbi:argininosuccinate lyase [Nitritalea halalkaliphila LW7]|uniref:Argininosuccinate lyase n=1 Tax=Nitritalea halalkaliphila LW7 TaxID=1189621 RepID=I5C390_9BACT|nr:argininosuccinate lyase [Nitritalea halalkaliphila]EIM76292.1 argininosuccinate lyase [Nitritalea halalkaliphila LW7]
MKIWEKDSSASAAVDRFTIGRDPEFDALLAPWDVLGSIAHARMLQEIGLLEKEEWQALDAGLKAIYAEIQAGTFSIAPGVEDVHSQVEFLLTERLGDVGKKLHSGRSRNDQVLVDLKLFYRQAIADVVQEMEALFDLLQALAARHAGDLMPGYTHTQLAMPSSFGLWFSSFAEGLSEDLDLLHAAYRLVDKNPLGSAAGYGSSFPLNRARTTELLGFRQMHYNVLNAQNSRGKTERQLAFALSGVAATLNRLAADAILFMNQHFGFIRFPDALTTGSSIMPHKKNPDVFELIRAKTNQLQGLPGQIQLLLTNLTTGYHRDLQLLKEGIFPAIETLKDCLRMSRYMLEHIEIKADILQDPFYKHVFSVEAVNKLVIEGLPFRDAYKQVGRAIENDAFTVDQSRVDHVHAGSIGNLCLEEISADFRAGLQRFDFEPAKRALSALLT